MTCGRKIGPFECCSVVCCDCLEAMREIPDGAVDCVITDPPYGIGESNERNLSREKNAKPRDYGFYDWDKIPVSPEAIAHIRRIGKTQVIFGGNYYNLPPSPCWLVWDKKNTGDFADCELAWTNMDKAVRIIHWLWNGMIRRDNEERFHPTQKPLGVMKWVISQAGMPKTIIDPYCGSGTTLCAAAEFGLHYLGFDTSEHWCRIARERIARIEAQPTLFESKPEQMKL